MNRERQLLQSQHEREIKAAVSSNVPAQRHIVVPAPKTINVVKNQGLAAGEKEKNDGGFNQSSRMR